MIPPPSRRAAPRQRRRPATHRPGPMFWVASVAVLPGLARHDDAVRRRSARCAPAFPHASAADMSWVLNAYTVVYAAMLIPAGGLADTHGRKRVFLLGVTLFIAASARAALAGSVGWLIAARVLQAVGAALLTPASLSIVLGGVSAEQARGRPSACGARSAASRPPSGRASARSSCRPIGWPWAFFINLPIGAVSLWWGASLLTRIGPPRHASARRRSSAWRCWSSPSARCALAIVEAESPSWTPRAARGGGRHRLDRARRRSSSGRARRASRSSTWRCSATGPTAR